jgi:hypothetical protein
MKEKANKKGTHAINPIKPISSNRIPMKAVPGKAIVKDNTSAKATRILDTGIDSTKGSNISKVGITGKSGISKAKEKRILAEMLKGKVMIMPKDDDKLSKEKTTRFLTEYASKLKEYEKRSVDPLELIRLRLFTRAIRNNRSTGIFKDLIEDLGGTIKRISVILEAKEEEIFQDLSTTINEPNSERMVKRNGKEWTLESIHELGTAKIFSAMLY